MVRAKLRRIAAQRPLHELGAAAYAPFRGTVSLLSDYLLVTRDEEGALRLLRETQGEDAIGRTAKAEDIELEYRGIPLRAMPSRDRYGIEGGAEIAAAFVPQPTEKMLVPREAEYQHLDAQIMAEPGVPSTGTIKRIVAKCGKTCQVCWRSRWRPGSGAGALALALTPWRWR